MSCLISQRSGNVRRFAERTGASSLTEEAEHWYQFQLEHLAFVLLPFQLQT